MTTRLNAPDPKQTYEGMSLPCITDQIVSEDKILSTTEATTTSTSREECQEEYEEEVSRWRPRRKRGRPGNITEALLERAPKPPKTLESAPPPCIADQSQIGTSKGLFFIVTTATFGGVT